MRARPCWRSASWPDRIRPSGNRWPPICTGSRTACGACASCGTSPSGSALTVDAEGRHPGDDDFDAGTREVFGFSAHLDRTAVLGPFLAGLGGTWQDEEGGFTFASEQGVAAVQYLADLAGADLAPDGAETAQEPSKCLSLFLEGKLGLLQTGTYDLGSLASGIDGSFPWSIHPVVAGPQGPRDRTSVVT